MALFIYYLHCQRPGKRSIKGLRAPGGFIVDIEWQDGELRKAKLNRPWVGIVNTSYYELKGNGLQTAKGANPNAFFAIPEMKAPLIHTANLKLNINVKLMNMI
jgi:hypothetical protein